MTKRRMVAISLAVVLATAAGSQLDGQKGKPGTGTTSPNWPCQIVFHDSEDDMIQSDGQGAYKEGEQGVQCNVNRYENAGNYGNLFVNADRSSPRYLWLPENVAVEYPTGGRSWYSPFENRQPGYFEIARVDTVTIDQPGPHQRRIRVGVGYHLDFDGGAFWGDGAATDPMTSGTHSATVTATGHCSWEIAWHRGEGTPRVVALHEGSTKKRRRTGDFELPFSATVTVTGVKPSCPAPAL